MKIIVYITRDNNDEFICITGTIDQAIVQIKSIVDFNYAYPYASNELVIKNIEKITHIFCYILPEDRDSNSRLTERFYITGYEINTED